MKKKSEDGKQGESRYALKQRRKHGKGPIDPRWVSWFEASDAKIPRRFGAPT